MTMAVSANRLELLQIADAVAREKSIDRKIVIAAMEDAIQKAAQLALRRGERHPRRDQPQDRRDPAARALLEVVETVENPATADRARGRAARATRPPRSATSSPSRCRRSTSAASPPRPPSR